MRSVAHQRARGWKERRMRHSQWLLERVAVVLVVITALGGPLLAYAEAPAGQDAAPATARLDTMAGSIDVQRGAFDGHIALGRGNIALNAKLADSGPDGQFSLDVPGQFALDLTASNGDLDSAMCAVLGPQEIRASGGRGSGLHLQFRNAEADPTACGLPSNAHERLTMAPNLIGAQATPPADSAAAQDGVMDGARRLLILVLIGGLMLVFAPGLSGRVTAAARTRPWSRLGLGLCLLITMPVVGVLIFALGLAVGLWWLGLLVLMFFACLLAVSMALSGLVLGAWLLERVRAPRIPLVASFATGLLVVTVLGLLPTVGPLVNV